MFHLVEDAGMKLNKFLGSMRERIVAESAYRDAVCFQIVMCIFLFWEETSSLFSDIVVPCRL